MKKCQDAVPDDPFDPFGPWHYEPMGNPYAAQVIAKYQTVINTCPNNCIENPANLDPTGGPPPGGVYTGGNIDCSNPPSYSPYVSSVCNLIAAPPIDGGASCAMPGTGGGFCAWRQADGSIAGHYHNGNDIRRPPPPPDDWSGSATLTVQSVHDGTVNFVGWRGGYGYRIEVTDAEGCTSSYSHLDGSSITVTADQLVTAGQDMAIMDNTGHSFGTHLHFSMMKDGMYLSPDNDPRICSWFH